MTILHKVEKETLDTIKQAVIDRVLDIEDFINRGQYQSYNEVTTKSLFFKITKQKVDISKIPTNVLRWLSINFERFNSGNEFINAGFNKYGINLHKLKESIENMKEHEEYLLVDTDTYNIIQYFINEIIEGEQNDIARNKTVIYLKWLL